jgi:hypothetical protein
LVSLRPGYTFLILYLQAGPILAPTGITSEPFLDPGESAPRAPEVRRWELLGGLRGRILAVGLKMSVGKEGSLSLLEKSYVSAYNHPRLAFCPRISCELFIPGMFAST